MNLPNKLTVFRVILVIPFVLTLLGQTAGWGWFDAIFGGVMDYMNWISLAIFVVACLTDQMDGHIARKYNMITDFGKFLDPLADKVLVAAALICMVELGYTAAWLVWVIMAREFMVSGIRLVAAGSKEKIVIAANIWGKLKTASTMVAICVILILHTLGDFGIDFALTQLISDILMYICTALTVISGAIYVWDYRAVLKE